LQSLFLKEKGKEIVKVGVKKCYFKGGIIYE
jgi:hypothetical protein